MLTIGLRLPSNPVGPDEANKFTKKIQYFRIYEKVEIAPFLLNCKSKFPNDFCCGKMRKQAYLLNR